MWSQRDTEIYNRIVKLNKLEEKSFPVFVVNSDTALRQVEAIVSVFGVRDLVDDIIHPGAYTKTIVERTGKIRVLDNHRTDSTMAALGKPLFIKELKREELPAALLQQYPEATGGLWTLTQFDDTPEGMGVFNRIVSGTINEWSIGFDVLSWDRTTVTNADGKKISIRNIREIRLWEYSAVLWGANQATWTVDAKGNPLVKGDEKMPNVNKSQADAPNYMPAAAGYNRCSACYFFDPSGQCIKYAFKADADHICDSYKAGSGGKNGDKPTTEKTVEGIEESMGATLIARVYDCFIAQVNGWLADSNVTVDEHRQLVATGGDLIDFITSAIPTPIMEREIEDHDPFLDMMLWAASGAQQLKRTLSREAKAGRVLSKANATKLVTAVEQIQDVLTVAGIYEQAKETEDAAKGKSQPTQPEAEPQEALTLSEGDELLKSYKAAQEAVAQLKESKNDVSGKPRTS